MTRVKKFIEKVKVKNIIICLLVLIIYMLFFNMLFLKSININEGEKIDIVIENNLVVKENLISFESDIDKQKVNVSYFFDENIDLELTLTLLNNISYGDIYTITVDSVNNINNSFYNSNSFNYKGYMLSKKIKEQIVVRDFEYKGRDSGFVKNILYSLKNYRKYLVLKIENLFPVNSIYINSLVLGEKIEDDKLKENIQKIGIVQLFTISGLHINFLVEIIEKLLKKFKIEQKYIDNLILGLLPIYGILCNMGVSIIRVIQMRYVDFYFKYKREYKVLSLINLGSKRQVTKFDIWLYVFIFNIILNPFNLLNIGFIFSYFITLYLILNHNIFKEIKSDFLRNYYITTFMLPVAINLNYKFNVLIFFTLKYYDYLIKYMMIISMLIVLFLNFPTIINLFNIILTVLVICLDVLNFFNLSFVLTISQIGVIGFLFYYYFYYKQLEEVYYYKGSSYKYLKVMICIFLFFCMNINILGKVDIIDVGQGDSILIKYPLNGNTVLIDTGDESAKDEIVKHLESEGVNKIDYFILTHNHMDHMANMEEIFKNFKVENLVINNSYYLQYEEYFNSSLFEEVNIIKVSGLVNLPIGYVWCYGNYLENENNNSIVLYTKLGFKKWLFMGDIEAEVEEGLVNKYNLDVDYVKLGHHGSKTSTTENFLVEASPLEVFISSGRNNMYGHPSLETVEKLDKYNIKYEDTQEDGEIVKYFI